MARWNRLRQWLRLRRFETALKAEPDSVRILGALALYLEGIGKKDRAGSTYARMALIHARAGDIESAAFCTRKFEFCGLADPARVFRELATVFATAGRFADAARVCRRVAESYVADGHARAVAGFLKQLPPLGPYAEATRAELEDLAAAALGVDSQESDIPEPATRRPVEEVFLSGTLGRVGVYDVVQMVESNQLTGRLDITSRDCLAHIYFSKGRVVAARRGVERGYPAARRALTIKSGRFKVVTMDAAPPDEFHVPNNTSLLLDVLREIDESTQEDPEWDDDQIAGISTLN